MRKIIENQLKIGQVDIGNIELDLRSRDEIPQLLIGLQAIYNDRNTREQVFEILQQIIPANIDTGNGRPGMDLWTILVLGTLRLNCNWDYDKLQEIANNHKTVREFLGHTIFEFNDRYGLQTLKDNVGMFTPKHVNLINAIVVKSGHKMLGYDQTQLKGRCDSFVVETDVHYPTDINLLWDAIRKIVTLIARLCDDIGITEWRQYAYILRKIKKKFNRARKLKRSNSKDETRKAEKQEEIIHANQDYVDFVKSQVDRAKFTIGFLRKSGLANNIQLIEIEHYIIHAERQMDQILRRVVKEEKIPHCEKVFSIFEEHTEWINKGKAGVSQELGLKVCVLEDQHGFILNHHVMQGETDDKRAVPIVKDTKEIFPSLISCSFDKGFHSPKNQKDLKEILEHVILPRKGRLSKEARCIEYSENFVRSRRKHSAVESGINALENHGLDRCLDHSIDGFKRYVALAVLSRNIQKLGAVLQRKELETIVQQEKSNSCISKLAA